jgi:hypothetical protein
MGGGTGGAGRGAAGKLLASPCLLGIPVSVGITPGVHPGGSGGNDAAIAAGGNDKGEAAQVLDASTSTLVLPCGGTWIGSGEEHAAHVCLQGLLGRVVWTFHSADTKTYGDVIPSSTSAPSLPRRGQPHHGMRRRMVCLPLAAPSRIGGADAVPKVGIVCPAPSSPLILSAGMEVTGNASPGTTSIARGSRIPR